VTLGDLVLDVVVRLLGQFAPASDTPGTVRFRQGGSAANAARVVAHLGGGAVFVGAIGRDAWGRVLERALADAGVTLHVVRVAVPTARITVLVEPDGERSFVTERSAADQLTAEHLRPAWFRGASALHLPAYSLLAEPLAGAATTAVQLTRAAGGIVSVDLASSRPLLSAGRAAAWQRLAAIEPDVLFGNAGEAATLLGRRPRDRLLELAPVVIIKRGTAGCDVLAGRRGERGRCATGQRLGLAVPTHAFAVTDTTGAGDAFDAGFLLDWCVRGRVEGAGAGRERALWAAARAGHRAAARHLRAGLPELRI
jgi:sugar/nucleoside kinase (ribokinase family)